MEAVSEVSVAVTKYAFANIKLHFSYLSHYKHNIHKLQQRVENLEGVQNDLRRRVNQAERKIEVISPSVSAWLSHAAEVEKEVKFLLEKVQCYPNPISRYMVSKTALRMKFEIDCLLEEHMSFVDVSFPVTPRQVVSLDVMAFESRREILNGIIKALEDYNVRIIGVFGIGGAGKTSLVKEVAKVAVERQLFSETLNSTLSSTPDLLRFQNDIATQLGLELEEMKADKRADCLHKRLTDSESVLLILDDVWNTIDLDAVGIPRSKSCKIILTSRDKRVCKMMGCDMTFEIKSFLPDEAASVFTRHGGDTIYSGADLFPVAEEMVEEEIVEEEIVEGLPPAMVEEEMVEEEIVEEEIVEGLPPAISTKAKASKGSKSCYDRTSALRHLKENAHQNFWHSTTNSAQKIEEASDDPYSWLQENIPLFEAEEKYIFFLCMFFAIDADISVEDLMRYGMGSIMFENAQGIKEARNKTQGIVEKLKKNALLIEGMSDQSVIMPDLVRDFFMSMKSGGEHKFLLEEGESVDKWTNSSKLTDYSGISLLDTRIEELPDGLHCPVLEVFKFQSHPGGQTLKIPKNFFTEMKNLRVLVMNGTSIPSLSSSITELMRLQTLCLEDCKLEPEEISIIGELEDLKILSLRQSEVARLPEEIRRLEMLKILDLTGCWILDEIPKNLLSNLTSLECLCMLNSFDQWGIGNNANLEELNKLGHLISLEIKVREITRYPGNLSFPNLMRFHIVFGSEVESDKYMESDKSLLLEGIDFKDPALPEGLQKLVNNAKLLVFKNCSEVSDSGLRGIASLLINRCNSIKRIESNEQKVDALKVLKLIKMKNKTDVWHPRLLPGTFSNLTDLHIEGCDSLQTIFTSSILQKLRSLTSISIQDCKSVTKVCDKLPNRTDIFGHLDKLKLQKLPELLYFCQGPSINFKILKELHVSECPKMRMFTCSQQDQQGPFFDEKVELNALEELTVAHIQNKEMWSKLIKPKSFPRLKILNVEKCDGFSIVVPANGIQSLGNLIKLSVKECDSLLEVFEVEITNLRVEVPLLNDLSLVNLPHLRSFCSGDSIFEWPSLGKVYLDNCPDMKTFCPRIKETPKLSAISHPYHGSLWEGDLNRTVEHLYKLTAKEKHGKESLNVSQLQPDGNVNQDGISITPRKEQEMRSENSGEPQMNKMLVSGLLTGVGREESSGSSAMRVEGSIDLGGLGSSSLGDGPCEDARSMQQRLAFTDQVSREAIRAVVLEVLYGPAAPEGAMHHRPIIDEVHAQARDIATQHVVNMISAMHQACLGSQETPPSSLTPGGP